MRALVRVGFAAAVAVGVVLATGGVAPVGAQAPAKRERAAHAWDSPRPAPPERIKCVKIAVENATGEARPASDIVIPITELRKVAPDFQPGAVIVTATDATTVEEDAAVIHADELPSQVDATDNEAQAAELAFQIDLKPHQKRIVTISYGQGDRIWKLRGDYAKRTDALFSWKFEGPGWENDVDAFRMYFDERNGIDLYGKIRPTLQLRKIGSPDYLYYDESPEGRDIFKVGAAMGIGGVGVLVNGQTVKPADVKERKWRVVTSGPVRSILEMTYTGWSVGGKTVNLRSRFTIWAGEYGFHHAIHIDGDVPGAVVTGLPIKAGIAPISSAASGAASGGDGSWVALWGEQVVSPGAAEAGTVAGQNLGVAVISADGGATIGRDTVNELMNVKVKDGAAEWFAMAAWDQYGKNRLVGAGARTAAGYETNFVLPPNGVQSQSDFVAKIKDQEARLSHPATWAILSTAPITASDAMRPVAASGKRSYADAIELVRKQIDQTAAAWEPVLTGKQTEDFGPYAGQGFFSDASNTTGLWNPQRGYFWTGSFWTGENWLMYARTHDEKYRKWAELWGSKLIGAEMTQNHDAGFFYYYSSVLGYQQTKDADLRASALRGATRLEQLYNPTTHLIASWGVGGNDTIIDTMMNLQLLWWASRETGDPKWKDIAVSHATRASEWFIRGDGSTYQSAHYNPGNNPQEFEITGGPGQKNSNFIHIPNDAAPGDLIFTHTHQGFAADTTWSRGASWAIYGFTAAYNETKDPKYLTTAEKVADYVVANLPADGVPWYDFDDEGVHYRLRDSSAAAITADGLLRLSEAEPDKERAARYRAQGERITQSLIDAYLTPLTADDSRVPGMLLYGCSIRPNTGPLIYGQYYLLETLMWLDAHGTKR
jgi:unsaturated chondroitin disaccharide hydrolase